MPLVIHYTPTISTTAVILGIVLESQDPLVTNQEQYMLEIADNMIHEHCKRWVTVPHSEFIKTIIDPNEVL